MKKKIIIILSLLGFSVIGFKAQAMVRTAPRMVEQTQAGLRAASTYYRNPLATRTRLTQEEIKRCASEFTGQPKSVEVSTKRALDEISTPKLLESFEKRGQTEDLRAWLILGGIIAGYPFYGEWMREANRQAKLRDREREVWSHKWSEEELQKKYTESRRKAVTEQTPYEWEW